MPTDKPHENELWWVIAVLNHPGQYDVDEKDKARDVAVAILQQVKQLKRRLAEDAELGLGLGLQVYIDGILNFFETGEEW